MPPSYQFLGVGLACTMAVALVTSVVPVPNLFEDSPVVDRGVVRGTAGRVGERLVPVE
jgi:hypothetical protein